MTEITLPEKLTAKPYLRHYQTIKKGGIDTKIMQISPVDRIIREIPTDIEVVFNEPVQDITITNTFDNTTIDKSYIAYYEDEWRKYDHWDRNEIFPSNLRDNVYILTWKYYFTEQHWVEFTLNYTDSEDNEISYSFILYNQRSIQPGDYILAKDQQPGE